MASSIVHLAVIEELSRKFVFRDLNRLKLGAVIVDYGRSQAETHLKKSVWGLNKKTYDLDRFRAEYGDLMRRDDLYLGYYLHLIQDLCYRHFVYDKYKWDPTIPGNVERLHRDYSIMNYYVTCRYGLKNDLTITQGFENEPLNRLSSFDTGHLSESMEGFFKKVDDEDIFFFTKEMTDEYIAEASGICFNELKALESGAQLTDCYEEAWESKPYSLLETTLNTRELGGYRIEGTDRYTKYGCLFRSDVANYPSERDISFLKNNGITTIIDTRSPDETERKPHGLAGIEGFEYHNIPIPEGSGIPESVEAVPASYFSIAHSSGINEVYRLIAGSKTGVMFGCAAGKDRTGVISALILWLCGVRKSDIIYDYMRTKQNNEPRFELIRQNFPDIDMNIVIPNENNMAVFMDLIEKEHQAVEGYFEAVGIMADLQEIIKNKFIK